MHGDTRDGRRIASLGFSIGRVARSDARNRADRVVGSFSEQGVRVGSPVVAACQRRPEQHAPEADSESDQRGSSVHIAECTVEIGRDESRRD